MNRVAVDTARHTAREEPCHPIKATEIMEVASALLACMAVGAVRIEFELYAALKYMLRDSVVTVTLGAI